MSPELSASNNPLDQLRPIVSPSHDISLWPLAPGWWLLLILLMVSIVLWWRLQPWLRARRAEKQLKSNTQQLLQDLYMDCESKNDRALARQHYLQGSNDIFKRVVHYYLPQSASPTFSGQPWIDFLQAKSLPLEKNYAPCYGNQLYARRCEEEIPLQDLHQWAEHWLTAFQKYHKKWPRIST